MPGLSRLKIISKYIPGKDAHGNLWAKKEHFNVDDKGKAIDIDYDKVKAYMKGLNMGRSNKTSPASAVYR